MHTMKKQIGLHANYFYRIDSLCLRMTAVKMHALDAPSLSLVHSRVVTDIQLIILLWGYYGTSILFTELHFQLLIDIEIIDDTYTLNLSST